MGVFESNKEVTERARSLVSFDMKTEEGGKVVAFLSSYTNFSNIF